MVLKYLIQKEFLQIRRNSFIPRLIIMFPIIVMCVMPWVMNLEVKNVVVSIVDNDRSTLSEQLVHRIEASKYFVFGGQKSSYKEAIDDIEASRSDIIIDIPPHFERDLQRGENPQILLATNAVNGTKGNMGSQYVKQIITHHVAPNISALESKISVLFLYNRNLDYKLFMIPALMAILVLLLCGFLPALNIVAEKEKGTIEAINVTPVSKASFILAKLIPYWLIAMVVMSISFFLAWFVYGITSEGNLALAYLLAMLLALIFSGLGLVISNYNDTMQQAVFVMWFTVVCVMLLSGLFTPVRSMPDWAYMTTYVNPVHYFIDGIRTVFVRGGDFSCIRHQVFALATFALVMNSWAVWSYKKNS